jgi:hypothetical protein
MQVVQEKFVSKIVRARRLGLINNRIISITHISFFKISGGMWGKSIERDHIMKGKSKYCGGVKIRDKKKWDV